MRETTGYRWRRRTCCFWLVPTLLRGEFQWTGIR